MSIIIGNKTRVLTQGITGKVGSFHTRRCIDYALGRNCFVGGVHPKKGGEIFDGIPIFRTIEEGKSKTNANASVVYVPPLMAASAIIEAVEADLELVVCITEGIPVKDMLKVRNRMIKLKSKTMLLGPNCPGLIAPEVLKIGIMPEHIHKKGSIGIVSRSGTLTYEAVDQVTNLGLGQSTAVGIGGDPINGLKHLDILKLFNNDNETEAVVMIGEIGGKDEIYAAEWAKENMKKPIVAFIAGASAPEGKRMGHAGALISDGFETVQAKLNALEDAGIKITQNPSEMGKLLKNIL
ncbi:MAG: succinate--CoA ligase subunit alpha [Betaproteobacteria bacterium TMED100]|nr:MAG: succinate--CoA ligase subunit alpha [Betaproteobacteria bacterium TMED100]